MNNSDEDSDIDLEEMKKDPKVRKFLKLMLNHEPVRKEKGKSKGKTPSPVTSHQKGVTYNLINNAVSVVISAKTYWLKCQDDTFFELELFPSNILSSEKTNYKNDIQ